MFSNLMYSLVKYLRKIPKQKQIYLSQKTKQNQSSVCEDHSLKTPHHETLGKNGDFHFSKTVFLHFKSFIFTLADSF